MKIPFSPPYIDEDVKAEVLSALDSGWITSGPKVLELESLVANFTGCAQVVCCNSATSGLMLMLHWYGVTRGDEVMIPAYTYAATALAVLHLGATPVMIDSGVDFNMDPSLIEKKITSRTKAIIPVDFAGWPCDYNKIFAIVKSADAREKFVASHPNQEKLGRIMVLADAAHSLGAVYEGQPTGVLADFTVFSFHAVKNVTTAEGGAICINLPESFGTHEMYKTLKLWSLNGQTKDALTKTTNGGWKYDIVYPGFKMNMPDICAAIGVAQLKKYASRILPERKRIFEAYTRGFSAKVWTHLPQAKSGASESSYHVYPLRVHGISERQRDEMINNIEASGVSVNVHFQPLPILSYFKSIGYKMEDYPVAYDNYKSEISLPVYPQLAQSQVDRIVEATCKSYAAING